MYEEKGAIFTFFRIFENSPYFNACGLKTKNDIKIPAQQTLIYPLNSIMSILYVITSNSVVIKLTQKMLLKPHFLRHFFRFFSCAKGTNGKIGKKYIFLVGSKHEHKKVKISRGSVKYCGK